MFDFLPLKSKKFYHGKGNRLFLFDYYLRLKSVCYFLTCYIFKVYWLQQDVITIELDANAMLKLNHVSLASPRQSNPRTQYLFRIYSVCIQEFLKFEKNIQGNH